MAGPVRQKPVRGIMSESIPQREEIFPTAGESVQGEDRRVPAARRGGKIPEGNPVQPDAVENRPVLLRGFQSTR